MIKNPHYRVVTKWIPLTTTLCYVEFMNRSLLLLQVVMSDDKKLTQPHPPVLTQLHTGQLHVLRFSYDCHQRWLVGVKHSLMWGSVSRSQDISANSFNGIIMSTILRTAASKVLANFEISLTLLFTNFIYQKISFGWTNQMTKAHLVLQTTKWLPKVFSIHSS